MNFKKTFALFVLLSTSLIFAQSGPPAYTGPISNMVQNVTLGTTTWNTIAPQPITPVIVVSGTTYWRNNTHSMILPNYTLPRAEGMADRLLFVDGSTGAIKVSNSFCFDSRYQPIGTYLTNEVDPTVSSWAKAVNKPTYTPSEVGAYPLSGNPSGFLTSFTENDPTVAAFIKAITTTDISNWNNKQNSLGYTPVNDARTITINGISQDLTTNRIWNVGDVTSSALTATLSNYVTSTSLTATLGGYATTSALAGKENIIVAGATSQYWRGDKTWQTLDKNSVGLANVSNTADSDKPVSTATQTAINTKQNTLVSGTNIKTVNGNSILGSGDLTVGVNYTAGTGISIASNVITNTVPDQIVSLTGANNLSVTGTYPNFTITQYVPTVFNPTRTLNSNFTISTIKQANVNYSISLQVTNPLLIGTSTAAAYLEYSINSGSTWVSVSDALISSGVGVAVAVAITNTQTQILTGTIPANALVRIRTTTSGTASVVYVRGQETY